MQTNKWIFLLGPDEIQVNHTTCMLLIVHINHGLQPMNLFCSSYVSMNDWEGKPNRRHLILECFIKSQFYQKRKFLVCWQVIVCCLYADYGLCFNAQHHLVSTFTSLWMLGQTFFSHISHHSCITVKLRKAGSLVICREPHEIQFSYQHLDPFLTTFSLRAYLCPEKNICSNQHDIA